MIRELTEQKIEKVSFKIKKVLLGNRIPKHYYITSGVGESDYTIHAGSFDYALAEAGIQDYNIIQYSSIMPKDAVRVEQPKSYEYGSVAEVIMANQNGKKGEQLTAGMIIGSVINKKTGKKEGGLVAEYHGNLTEEETRQELINYMNEMYKMRHGGDPSLKLGDLEIYSRSLVPSKKYGSVLVAIVFTTYEYPVIKETIDVKSLK